VNPDDEVCYCYHVSLRKLVNYARLEHPRAASQMSDCFGAGTGCGWCIPVLCRIHEAVQHGQDISIEMTPEEYAAARAAYRSEKRPRNQFEPPAEPKDSSAQGSSDEPGRAPPPPDRPVS
jgi:NAD(P)H-nitrite reductase large subunit